MSATTLLSPPSPSVEPALLAIIPPVPVRRIRLGEGTIGH